MLSLVLTPGQRHDAPCLPQLLQEGAVRRRSGRPKQRPVRLIADTGYSSQQIRQYLRQRGIRYTIRYRRDARHPGRVDPTLYRQRNRIERFINRIKHFRRIATRYEKRAANYRTMWLLAAIFIMLQ